MRKKLEAMLDLYADLKREIRRANPNLYEQWKAGGFLVDDDILSMYPDITTVVDRLEGDDEDSDE